MTRATAGLSVLLLACVSTGCRCDRGRPAEPAPPATSASPTTNSGAEPARDAAAWPELGWYRWVKDPSYPVPEPVDTVLGRFAHTLPPGYGGTPAELGTFEEWLRLLPLAAPGTPVRNYRGEMVVPGDDEHLAAVVAVDLGPGDSQQSADAVLRLYAEWRWFKEDLRLLFLSDTKLELPLQKWLSGERLVASGAEPKWVPQAAPQTDPGRAAFREYLNAVFTWSDGPALLAESVPLQPDELAPGAFFVHQGHPAEALLVLDVGISPAGERVMLLAQALNPAENIHVIRPSRDSVWFPADQAQPVRVPRARPFSWQDLRRLKLLLSRPEVECVGSLCPPSMASSGAPKR